METPRMRKRNPAHELRQVNVRSWMEHEMPAVWHHAESENTYVVFFFGLEKDFFKRGIVLFFSEDFFSDHGHD